jgi:ATP-binding cassette subfamily B multidrug efflux pump
LLTRLLRRYLRPFTRVLSVVVVLQLVQTMANLSLPRLQAEIIDRGIARGDRDSIWTAGAQMLALTGLQIAAMITAVYFGARIAAGFGRNLRADLFERVGAFSSREINAFGAPTLITRSTNDVQQVQTVTQMGMNMLVSVPITVVGGVYMALREDVRLSWLLLVCIPLMAGALGFIVFRLVPRFREMQARIDRINGVLREQLSGMRVVRAFVREPYETARFEQANADVTSTAMQVGQLMAFMFPVVMLVFNASGALVLWFGASRVESGAIEVGSLIAFLTYLTQILMSVMMATFVSTMIPRASVCADRIGEVLDTVPSVTPPAQPIASVSEHALIEFDSVEFRYPAADSAILHDISFCVRSGETTAVIGATGAGKTTLVHLIPRLMDTTGGTVRVNGVDVRDLEPALLAATVGVVPQLPYLFSGTVASNLRYGNPEASDEQLWSALRIAQADEFVRAMPDGLNAAISQGGTNVSGGQRQRLAIARAIVRQPEIYVFDDAFSALDMATDARLRAALETEMRNTAVLIVAQRVSTIRNADRIIVLDAGRMCGEGTHDELLQTCETYKEIVASQMRAEEAA